MSIVAAKGQPAVIRLRNEAGESLAGIPVCLGERSIKTDLDGRALFLGLESGAYQLRVDAADFRPLRAKVTIAAKGNDLGFELKGFVAGGIKGSVRLSGAEVALPDAEVKLAAATPEEAGTEALSFWTDWDGNYSGGRIPVGPYDYTIKASRCEPQSGRIYIEKDSTFLLSVDLEPVPDPVKITVKVVSDDGTAIDKCRVRLLEGMGEITVAAQTGKDTCVFADLSGAPFNQVAGKGNTFIGRNFVAVAEVEGYHTGYAPGDLRSGPECTLTVVCTKQNTGELIIRSADEARPVPIPLNEAMKVRIAAGGKETLLGITLPHSGSVSVKAGPNPFTTSLRVLDKDAKVIADTWNYPNQPVQLDVQRGSAELLIGIKGDVTAETLGALQVDYRPVINPYKPNDTFESALHVEFGEKLRPFLFPQNDANYFMVEVTRPGMMRARLTGCAITARLRILSPKGDEIVSNWNYPNQLVEIACPVYQSGLYRIALAGTNPADWTVSSATLRIEFIGTETGLEAFAPVTREPIALQFGKHLGGTIFPSKKVNLYSLVADFNGVLKARFQLSGCHSSLKVRDSKGTEIYSSWNYAGQSLNPDIPIREPGRYTLEIAGTDQGQQHIGSYSLGVFFYPADEYEGYQRNESPESAAAINLGLEVVGTIGVPGDVDYYRFLADCPGLMVQRTRRFPLNLALTVINPAGKEIFRDWNYAGQNLNREYHVLGTGLHLLKVSGTSPADYSPASYGFWLELIRVKPETYLNKRLVLGLNSCIKLDALLPGNVKAFMLPVAKAATLNVGARIPINARLIVSGPDGRELYNSWNYAGQPLQASIKLDAPANLMFTVAGTDPASWSKDVYIVYATDSDMPPEPALIVAQISEDNRKVTFNVSGSPAAMRRIENYELDFEGNGEFSKVAMGLVEHTYREGRLYTPRLRVTDDRGAVGTESTFLDLVDVSLMGLSCRIVSPADGEIVSRPQKVTALAGSGPGKRVTGMKLLLDGRPIATSRLSHIEADVDWRSLAPGDHAISVEASDADGHKAEAAAKFRVSDLFELWPEHGEVITGTRVVVTWLSPEATDTQVEYRKVGDQDWHRDEGRHGRHHKVVLDSVEAGVTYEFRAGDGKVWSDPRSFTLQKGLSFERARYGVTIPRDYGQAMPVTVRNNSDHPLEVVLECLPPDDKELLVGFVGEGSEDRPVHLPPGEIRQFRLVLSAQDCIHELHRFLVRIRSRDGYGDQAEVEVRVKIPKVDLAWEELETNSSTLGKKLRLVNKGDGLTDLTVRTMPDGAFRLRPSVEHAVLAANESMELWVDPVLYDGFTKVDGEVKIESFGKTFSHPLACAVPQGMQVYRVTVDPTELIPISSRNCTNRPYVYLNVPVHGHMRCHRPDPPVPIILPELPSSIWPSDGFNQLGKAIAKMKGFPTSGTDFEKATFVWNLMPDIKKKYGLSAGTGGILSQWDVLGGRTLEMIFGDSDGAGSMKYTGTGNCGEWSNAFEAMLDGAGVNCMVIFADNSKTPGSSWQFTGTDTALYVEDPKTHERRVFDIFRRFYHNQAVGWDNVPFADWLKKVGKKYIKEGVTEKVIFP